MTSGKVQRTAAALRTAEIAKIHILATQLGMDEEMRRAMLEKVTGKRSSKDMTWQERKRVIDHLLASGAKITTPKKAARRSPRAKSDTPSRALAAGDAGDAGAAPSRALDTSPMASKVRALWLALHELGAVRDPSEAALGAYVRRIIKVDALQWATSEQLDLLIETLKKWVIRVCRDLAPAALKAARLDMATLDELNDAHLQAVYRRLVSGEPVNANDAQDVIAALRRMATAHPLES
ncbi:MAG: hypothetical protein RIR00_146 [Pseudomonadota bacterium]|jgi:phage gp16-like protein